MFWYLFIVVLCKGKNIFLNDKRNNVFFIDIKKYYIVKAHKEYEE